MEEKILWLWLQNLLGAKSTLLKRIVAVFDDIREVYESDTKTLFSAAFFEESECIKLSDKNLDRAYEIFDDCHRLGYDILCYTDRTYPAFLKELNAPPAVLYVRGSLPDIDSSCIAMVGTRTPTAFGKEKAFELARELVLCGCKIISGGAKGIDTQAHMGALNGGGKTVCVLGCGLDVEGSIGCGRDVCDAIAMNGAIISEYPPGTCSAPYTYPQRNRIIAALSSCTVVVEGSKSSGSLITAKEAAELRRKIFAVPGDLNNPMAAGSNSLLKEGAAAILRADDLFCNLEALNPKRIEKIRIEGKTAEKARLASVKIDEAEDNMKIIKPLETQKAENLKEKRNESKSSEKLEEDHSYAEPNVANLTKEEVKEALESLSPTAAKIYEILEYRPMSVDVCMSRTGLPVNRVLSALMELSLKKLAKRCTGCYYEKII